MRLGPRHAPLEAKHLTASPDRVVTSLARCLASLLPKAPRDRRAAGAERRRDRRPRTAPPRSVEGGAVGPAACVRARARTIQPFINSCLSPLACSPAQDP